MSARLGQAGRGGVARAFVLLAAACATDPGQHEITAAGELLTADGRLREAGWSPRQLLRWDAARVHDPTRLRQWDFFTIMDERAAVNLTLVDLGFLRVGSVSAIDLVTGERLESSVVSGSMQGFALSPALEGTASFSSLGGTAPDLRFETDGTGSRLAIDLANPGLGAPARGSLVVSRRPMMPYLSLATPFAGDAHEFFFEQKVPGMSADGEVTVGGRTFTFRGATATMDWGRGEWPSAVTWRWAAASGTADGVTLAFNLGEGFGDPRAGSENLVVLGDVPFKLGAVAWTHDATDPLAPWTMRSDDGRVDLVLSPLAPELGGIDLGGKFQHVFKAYGRFDGRLVLGGREVRVVGLLGFAERVDLSW